VFFPPNKKLTRTEDAEDPFNEVLSLTPMNAEVRLIDECPVTDFFVTQNRKG